MAIKKGDKVKVDYEGKLEDGTIFDSSKHGDHSHPIEFTVGENQVIPGFENGVIGLEKGDEKEIHIEPKDAYGEKNPELTKEFPKANLPKDQEPKIGMGLMLQAPTGQQIPAIISEVKDTSVVLDFNHPLAGKKLIFNVKVVEC